MMIVIKKAKTAPKIFLSSIENIRLKVFIKRAESNDKSQSPVKRYDVTTDANLPRNGIIDCPSVRIKYSSDWQPTPFPPEL